MTELERELEASEKMWRATTVLSQDEMEKQIAYDRNRIMRKHGFWGASNRKDEGRVDLSDAPPPPTNQVTSPVYSPAERTDGFKAR